MFHVLGWRSSSHWGDALEVDTGTQPFPLSFLGPKVNSFDPTCPPAHDRLPATVPQNDVDSQSQTETSKDGS